MTTSFTLTIDCADADQMMQFWTTALGYKPKDPPEGFDDWCSYFRSIGMSARARRRMALTEWCWVEPFYLGIKKILLLEIALAGLSGEQDKKEER